MARIRGMMPVNKSPILALAAGVFAVFSLTGCGPSQVEPPPPSTAEGRKVAKALCAAREVCGCSDARFTSTAQCESEIASIFDAAVQDGLVLDSACLEVGLESEIVQECPTWPWRPEDLPCAILRGTKEQGQPCKSYSTLQPLSVSDCNEGLFCYDGTCQAELPPIPAKLPGDLCTKDAGCGAVDLYCGQDQTCHSLRTSGQSCDDYLACGNGLYCEGLGAGTTGICAPRVETGGACNPKDWGGCESPDFPNSVYWCDSQTSTCAPGQPAVCRLTHPAAGY